MKKVNFNNYFAIATFVSLASCSYPKVAEAHGKTDILSAGIEKQFPQNLNKKII